MIKKQVMTWIPSRSICENKFWYVEFNSEPVQPKLKLKTDNLATCWRTTPKNRHKPFLHCDSYQALSSSRWSGILCHTQWSALQQEQDTWHKTQTFWWLHVSDCFGFFGVFLVLTVMIKRHLGPYGCILCTYGPTWILMDPYGAHMGQQYVLSVC